MPGSLPEEFAVTLSLRGSQRNLESSCLLGQASACQTQPVAGPGGLQLASLQGGPEVPVSSWVFQEQGVCAMACRGREGRHKKKAIRVGM